MSKNPYKAIEKAVDVAVMVVAVLLGAAALTAIGWSAAEDWGWGALWLIPGIPLGLVVILAIGLLGSMATEAIKDRWQRAKWRWEDKNDRSQS